MSYTGLAVRQGAVLSQLTRVAMPADSAFPFSRSRALSMARRVEGMFDSTLIPLHFRVDALGYAWGYSIRVKGAFLRFGVMFVLIGKCLVG